MAKFSPETVTRWKIDAQRLLDTRYGVGREDIVTPGDAWSIAHRAGITNEAYSDRSVTDAHIETALRKIFPNAWSK